MNFVGLNEDKRDLIIKLFEKTNIQNLCEYTVTYEKSDAFNVKKTANSIYVSYTSDSELFRSVLLTAELITFEKDREIKEERQFKKSGIMLDMSRAGVMTVPKIKEYIEYMALCGLNILYVYMEDVYEVECFPYFGYMRGKYTMDELKEIDEYASLYGIEAIPCIQTLGHFEQYIKWFEGKNISDTATVLMAENEEVYKFIEKIISTVSSCFKTNRIHVGMDEAWGIGAGKYLKEKGFKNVTDIVSEHIAKVKEITDKYNLEPVIWSDMYFRTFSKIDAYYDESVKIPDSVGDLLPENVGFTYWDYYHTDKNFYRHMLSQHKKFTDKVIFAGGFWTWIGFLPDYIHSFKSVDASLTVCKEQGIDEVFGTVWGDDGCETNHMFTLPGCVLYGEYSYKKEVTEEEFNKKLKILFNASLDDFIDISRVLYPVKQFEFGKTELNIKHIIYNDILCGMADADISEELVAHYNKYYEKYSSASEKDGYFKKHFEYVALISKLAADKINITSMINKGYSNDTEILEKVKDEYLKELEQDFLNLKNIHFEMWHETCKPFGFETVDGRYGAKLARIITTAKRLEMYLNGTITTLPELEEKRLPFVTANYFNGFYSGISSSYLTRGY